PCCGTSSSSARSCSRSAPTLSPRSERRVLTPAEQARRGVPRAPALEPFGNDPLQARTPWQRGVIGGLAVPEGEKHRVSARLPGRGLQLPARGELRDVRFRVEPRSQIGVKQPGIQVESRDVKLREVAGGELPGAFEGGVGTGERAGLGNM